MGGERALCWDALFGGGLRFDGVERGGRDIRW